jgi:hypothetical protein
MWVLIEMVDPLGIEGGSATLDAVNNVTLIEKEFSEVRTVLSSYTGY